MNKSLSSKLLDTEKSWQEARTSSIPKRANNVTSTGSCFKYVKPNVLRIFTELTESCIPPSETHVRKGVYQQITGFGNVLCESHLDLVFTLIWNGCSFFSGLQSIRCICTIDGAWSQFLLDIRNLHRPARKVLQDEVVAKVSVVLEFQRCFEWLHSGSIALYGLQAPPKNWAPLGAPQNKEKIL